MVGNECESNQAKIRWVMGDVGDASCEHELPHVWHIAKPRIAPYRSRHQMVRVEMLVGDGMKNIVWPERF